MKSEIENVILFGNLSQYSASVEDARNPSLDTSSTERRPKRSSIWAKNQILDLFITFYGNSFEEKSLNATFQSHRMKFFEEKISSKNSWMGVCTKK